jgi:vacuolar-type H+-ATPase subunit H
MDSSSALGVLQETRQHATQIAGMVNDLHAKLQQFEQNVDTRFAAIQHSQQDLLNQLQQERDRARSETQTLQQSLTDTTEWIQTTGTTLTTDAKSLTTDLGTAETESGAASTALQQAVEHLAQLTTTAKQHLDTHVQQTQTEVDQAHDQAHEQAVSTLTSTQQAVTAAAQQHETAITNAFENDFHSHQQEFHSLAEQTATQGAHTIADRGTQLHTNVQHDVDSLQQHQDQNHQDLTHKLDSVKQDLTHVGSLVTDTAHGLADGVDTASSLLQVTNVGVEEILKIIQNIESIFQDIIGSMHS